MATINRPAARGFYVGLAIGQIWLSLVSTSFVSLLWILGQNTVQISLILVSVGLIGLILLGASIVLLRSAWRLPGDISSESAARSRALGRKMGLRFGLIVLAEVVVIGAINTALYQTNHGDWVVPLTYFIVGLHFVPLAFVFRVRPYIILGLLWMIVILLTVILIPASMMVGQGLGA